VRTRGRRVVVTGATGNVGSRVVEALVADPAVGEVLGVARRRPRGFAPDDPRASVRWHSVDLTPRAPGASGPDPLDEVLRGADVVVHLAWLIQPTRDAGRLWEVNAAGTARLLASASRTGVDAVVHASSVGAYSPAPAGHLVDETWPTHGIATSSYSLAKAYGERLLDRLEAASPDTRVVRVRPALVVQRRAAAHVRRLFVGGLVPDAAFGAVRGLPFLPDVPGLAVQLVHAEDVARAIVAAVTRDVRGAFNLAASPPVSGSDLAERFGSRVVTVPQRLARAAVRVTHAAHLQPVDAGWLDLAVGSPLLRTDRAVRELDWRPRWDAFAALDDVLDGLRDGAGDDTPPLEGDDVRHRVVELATARQGRGEVR
jgi:UDP-glucose 4-epimerase